MQLGLPQRHVRLPVRRRVSRLGDIVHAIRRKETITSAREMPPFESIRRCNRHWLLLSDHILKFANRTASCFLSLRFSNPLQKLRQIPPPIEPGMAASRDAQLIPDAEPVKRFA